MFRGPLGCHTDFPLRSGCLLQCQPQHGLLSLQQQEEALLLPACTPLHLTSEWSQPLGKRGWSGQTSGASRCSALARSICQRLIRPRRSSSCLQNSLAQASRPHCHQLSQVRAPKFPLSLPLYAHPHPSQRWITGAPLMWIVSKLYVWLLSFIGNPRMALKRPQSNMRQITRTFSSSSVF